MLPSGAETWPPRASSSVVRFRLGLTCGSPLLQNVRPGVYEANPGHSRVPPKGPRYLSQGRLPWRCCHRRCSSPDADSPGSPDAHSSSGDEVSPPSSWTFFPLFRGRFPASHIS